MAILRYSQERFKKKLKRWQTYMENYSLPSWEELPDMELYMDQVVSLVNRYLDLIPHDENNPILTASAVNNYVRLRMMPAPNRKRYSRRHLATVIMICAMKQSLTLAEIQKILSSDLSEEDVREMYNDFVNKMTTTTALFIDQVSEVAEQALIPENEHGCESLILHSTVSSVLYKLLTVKLTGLREEEPDKGRR